MGEGEPRRHHGRALPLDHGEDLAPAVVEALHGPPAGEVPVVVRLCSAEKDGRRGRGHDAGDGEPLPRDLAALGKRRGAGEKDVVQRRHLREPDLLAGDLLPRVTAANRDGHPAGAVTPQALAKLSRHGRRGPHQVGLLPQRRHVARELSQAAVVPLKAERVRLPRGERRRVVDHEEVPAQVPDAQGPVAVAHHARARGGRAVRVEDAVHAEVAVVLPLPVVAAVGVAAVRVEHGVVDHLPHAAAHQGVEGVDLPPVVLDATRAHAHGVRVLAEEVRPVVEAPRGRAALAHAPHALDGGVHLAPHVVGAAQRVDGTLVVHGQARARPDELVHGVGVAAAARLVAQAPHDHARVQLVALHEALGAVEVAPLPAGVVGEAVLPRGELAHQGPVGLEVGLVDHVDAQLVAELQEVRVRRVVRGPDGIYVVVLAEKDVALGRLRRHGVARRGARVVVVDAVQLDRPTVHEKAPAVHARLAKAHALAHALRGRLQDEVVEVRGLRRPLEHVEPVEVNGRAAPVRMRLRHPLEPVPAQRHAHRALGNKSQVNGHAVAHATRPFFSARAHTHVPDSAGGDLAQQHVPEDAVVAEHVLALEVGARAPATHHGHELVCPRALVRRNIELRRVVRALRVAHAPAVEVEVEAAGDAQEGDDVAHGRLALVQVIGAAVDAREVVLANRVRHVRAPALAAYEREDRPHGALLGYARRVERELVALVHVEGPVVALELPAAGNCHAVPGNGVGVQDVRQLGGPRVEPEVPLPAQAPYEW